MKLRNRKMGEIADFENFERVFKFLGNQNTYSSIAELSSEWEDAPEEPKEFYVVDLDGEILPSDFENETIEKSKELGNYFETKEEAKLAVRKLKAWKRLKDKGFRFERWCFSKEEPKIVIKGDCIPDTVEELDLLFGGEE